MLPGVSYPAFYLSARFVCTHAPGVILSPDESLAVLPACCTVVVMGSRRAGSWLSNIQVDPAGGFHVPGFPAHRACSVFFRPPGLLVARQDAHFLLPWDFFTARDSVNWWRVENLLTSVVGVKLGIGLAVGPGFAAQAAVVTGKQSLAHQFNRAVSWNSGPVVVPLMMRSVVSSAVNRDRESFSQLCGLFAFNDQNRARLVNDPASTADLVSQVKSGTLS